MSGGTVFKEIGDFRNGVGVGVVVKPVIRFNKNYNYCTDISGLYTNSLEFAFIAGMGYGVRQTIEGCDFSKWLIKFDQMLDNINSGKHNLLRIHSFRIGGVDVLTETSIEKNPESNYYIDILSGWKVVVKKQDIIDMINYIRNLILLFDNPCVVGIRKSITNNKPSEMYVNNLVVVNDDLQIILPDEWDSSRDVLNIISNKETYGLISKLHHQQGNTIVYSKEYNDFVSFLYNQIDMGNHIILGTIYQIPFKTIIDMVELELDKYIEILKTY